MGFGWRRERKITESIGLELRAMLFAGCDAVDVESLELWGIRFGARTAELLRIGPYS